MQVSASFSTASRAQIALQLLQVASPATAPKAKSPSAGTGDIATLLAYAKKAMSAAKSPPVETAYDPAQDMPSGWSMGAKVSVDTLDPADRAFARSFGATEVRLYGPDPVNDEAFAQQASAYLDQAYADDAAYQSAKAAGQITIRRQSEVLAELGDRRSNGQHMAFYRGESGTEYFGSGSRGFEGGPEIFEGWQVKQAAAGQYVAVGGTMGLAYVATWPAT